MRLSVVSTLLLLAAAGRADNGVIDYGGHVKIGATHQSFPADSLFRDAAGAGTSDAQGELRFNVDWQRSYWRAEADYQLVVRYFDDGPLTAGLVPDSSPDDRRRWLDLTSSIDDSGDSRLLHRLDRLSLGFAGERLVVRFGRQALSWGNGLVYAPMDLVNPFDPAAVDTEYKAGDDMLYAQYVHGNGDDVQFAHVVRRDPLTGDVTADESTTAVKYHGFAGSLEYDVLLARSYDDDVLGIGLRRAIGGAEWGADAVLTRTSSDTYLQLVTNVSYSWTLRGRNVTGLAEYHYSGVGQRSGRYSPADFAANPELLARLLRGQSFTIGRHYLAGSATIELTPLWTMTPLLLTNVADPSALLQLTSQWSLTDNTVLLASLSVPLGGSGTEFGGIPAGIPDRFLSLRSRAFVQFAGYF